MNGPRSADEARFFRSIIAPLLYRLEPERAHELARFAGRFAAALPGMGTLLERHYEYRSERLRLRLFGLDFPNPVGMAAGFDKRGDLYPFLARMGFGFVESGTFTARAQPGNPRPRVFRYPTHEALVNRMGFNNPGADAAARLLARQRRSVPHGINLGKSKVAPLEAAVADYLYSLERLGPFADYIAINVSSPNTPELRKLQEKDRLSALLREIRLYIDNKFHGEKIPLLLKIAPDLNDAEFEEVLAVALDHRLDGLILTNTTLDRTGLPDSREEAGGLSGRPLAGRSTAMIARAFRRTEGRLPLVGVGGVFSAADALEKIQAGASLIQIYTGYIYRGPGLPAAINRGIDEFLARENVALADLVGAGKIHGEYRA